MIAVIAGAVPVGMIQAVHALLEFHYLTQASMIDEDGCRDIATALAKFHLHKQSIINAGAHCGDKGNVLKHWQIPKLEMMQNVAPSIPLVGPPINWTADTTECAHIDFINIPAAATNNNNYESQTCCFLDRLEKCRSFSLALHLREQQLGLPSHPGSSAVLAPDEDDRTKDNADAENPIDSGKLFPGEHNHSRPTMDYFKLASRLDGHHVSPP